jgi:hypothetical protein
MVLFYRMSCVILKKYTSKKNYSDYIEEPESRREFFWLILKKRVLILKRSVIKHASPIIQVWQDGYHAEIIETNWFIKQKLIIFTIIL